MFPWGDVGKFLWRLQGASPASALVSGVGGGRDPYLFLIHHGHPSRNFFSTPLIIDVWGPMPSTSSRHLQYCQISVPLSMGDHVSGPGPSVLGETDA